MLRDETSKRKSILHSYIYHSRSALWTWFLGFYPTTCHKLIYQLAYKCGNKGLTQDVLIGKSVFSMSLDETPNSKLVVYSYLYIYIYIYIYIVGVQIHRGEIVGSALSQKVPKIWYLVHQSKLCQLDPKIYLSKIIMSVSNEMYS